MERVRVVEAGPRSEDGSPPLGSRGRAGALKMREWKMQEWKMRE